VTLVHAHEQIMDLQPLKAQKLAIDFLSKMNVNFILGDRLLPHTLKDANLYNTIKGKEIQADMVIWATGLKPNTRFLKGTFLEKTLDNKGFIKTRNTFQVEGYDNIFALGDITAFPIGKMAANVVRQTSVLAKNIGLFTTHKPLELYKITSAANFAILTSIGKTFGVLTPTDRITLSGKFVPKFKGAINRNVMKNI